MRAACISFVANCDACIKYRAKHKFRQHENLYPIPKGSLPLTGWAIDLLVDLPPDSNNRTICVVGVDCFSKYVEASPLHNRQSSTLAAWFMSDIAGRYGRPEFVRTDQGQEFKGAFDQLLDQLGITH